MKKKNKSPQNKLLVYGVTVLVSVLLVAQLVVDIKFWHSASFSNATEPITTMIIQAVRGINKPAVIDPLNKNVYLPDANLVLPSPPQNLPNLEYSYSPAIDGSSAEADVTLTNAVNVGISKLLNAEATAQREHDLNQMFSAVPGLQVCVRGVHVVLSGAAKYDRLQFTKVLADGRTIKVYTERQSCAYNLQPLVEYLRQAQSY